MNNLDFAKLNLQDALDLAVLIEKEAEERYLEFVNHLGSRYKGDATDFFAMMAKNEAIHGSELAKRRKQLFGDAPTRVNAEMISDVEAPEYSKPRDNMSPRHALDIAMESETKAYEFFNKALPSIKDADVKKLFEELRDEELEHQNLLKEQMPKYPATLDPDVDPEDIETPEL